MARVSDALRAVTETAAHPVTEQTAVAATGSPVVNPLRVAAAAPAVAVGRTHRFAVVARSATGRTAPQ